MNITAEQQNVLTQLQGLGWSEIKRVGLLDFYQGKLIPKTDQLKVILKKGGLTLVLLPSGKTYSV